MAARPATACHRATRRECLPRTTGWPCPSRRPAAPPSAPATSEPDPATDADHRAMFWHNPLRYRPIVPALHPGKARRACLAYPFRKSVPTPQRASPADLVDGALLSDRAVAAPDLTFCGPTLHADPIKRFG